jgi:hypothetical protein
VGHGYALEKSTVKISQSTIGQEVDFRILRDDEHVQLSQQQRNFILPAGIWAHGGPHTPLTKSAASESDHGRNAFANSEVHVPSNPERPSREPLNVHTEMISTPAPLGTHLDEYGANFDAGTAVTGEAIIVSIQNNHTVPFDVMWGRQKLVSNFLLSLLASIQPGATASINTFVGHQIFLTEPGKSTSVVQAMTILPGVETYLVSSDTSKMFQHLCALYSSGSIGRRSSQGFVAPLKEFTDLQTRLEAVANGVDSPKKVQANYDLGACMEFGLCALPNDVERKTEAHAWFKKAADAGHVDATFRAGETCWVGSSRQQQRVSKKNALPWFTKAAELGHVQARNAQIYNYKKYRN